MKNSFVIGVDIGGSHITSAVVDLNRSIILDHTMRRASVNAQGGAEEIISSWCRIIKSCYSGSDMMPSKIGIAIPGPFDYVRGISMMKDQNKYDGLFGMNVKELLSERLSLAVEKITCSNDAACFLQGEVYGGAAKGCLRTIGLTLGTGFGSAMFIKGKAEDADFWCTPFRDGIAEDYLSTRWFVKRYFELTQRKVKDVKELTELKGDVACVQQIFQEFGRNLGVFLLPHVQEDEIDTIVVGGNIANVFNNFSGELKEVFKQNNMKVEVKKASLGENAALLGAATSCVARPKLNQVQ